MIKSATALAPETRLVRKTGLPSTVVDSDIVVLNIVTQKYIGLDEIGGELWELLAQPQRIDDLCRAMCDRYDGSSEEIAADVLSFLGELRNEGLIEVVA